MTREEVVRDVLRSRPRGWFGEVLGMVETYAGLVEELGALWGELHNTRPGTPESAAVLRVLVERKTLAFELFEMLGLGPHGRGRPPPRLQ